jgi:hypothetical protein
VRYLLATVLLCLCSSAFAQDGHFGHGHDQWHGDFYQRLVTPETKVSCCNLADCRPTSGRQVGDHYEVKVDGTWVPVLPSKVVKSTVSCCRRKAREISSRQAGGDCLLGATADGSKMIQSHERRPTMPSL